MPNKEFENILDAYDNLNKEEVSKSEEASKAQGEDEQVPANAQEEPKEPAKVEGTKEQNEENKKDQEKVEGQDTEEDSQEEKAEKSKKESKDPVDKEDTKTENKDNEKRKNKKEDKESDEDSEEDEDSKEEKSEDKEKDKTKKSEEDKEETSKSISDKQIVEGFSTILKSFELFNDKQKEFAMKSDLDEIKDSIRDLNENIDAKEEEPITKSTEYLEEESNEEDVVQKSATSETAPKGEKAQGIVSKSVEGESAVQDAPQTEQYESNEDTKAEEEAELRNAFMKRFKEYASTTPRNNELEIARQDYVNYQNGVATESQIQNIKRFAGLN